jgi:hypothetical protein
MLMLYLKLIAKMLAITDSYHHTRRLERSLKQQILSEMECLYNKIQYKFAKCALVQYNNIIMLFLKSEYP